MCVKPVVIRDKITRKVHLVPCGKCIECRRAYQNEWIFRLSQEIKQSPVPLFVTLTYNDEHLPLGDNGNITQSVVLKSDVQLFLKRLRKMNVFGKFRYFAVGEYGSKSTCRAHYHLVIMPKDPIPVSLANRVISHAWTKLKSKKFGVEMREPIGFVKVKFCTPKQVHYVCKYMNKLDDRKHLVKPFRLYSKGLGLCYLTEQVIQYYLTSFDRTCPSGKCRISLPRYFRKKLDNICECNPFMKKAGVTYTTLLPEVNQVIPKEGTRYAWFREFQQRLQKLSDFQYYAFENGLCYSLPNLNELFSAFYHEIPELCDLEFENKRRLEDCKIRNHLKKSVPPATFAPNENFLILKE